MLVSVENPNHEQDGLLRFMLDRTALEKFAIFSDFRIITNQAYIGQRKSTPGWNLEQGLVNDIKTILRLGHVPVEWPSIPIACLNLAVADTTGNYRYQLSAECHDGNESISMSSSVLSNGSLWRIEENYMTDDDRGVCHLDSMDGGDVITGHHPPYGQWNRAAIHVFDFVSDKNPDFDFVREIFNWCRR